MTTPLNLRLDECDYVGRNLRCVYVEADRLACLKLEGEGTCSVRSIRISVIVRLIVIVGLRSVIGLGSDASRIELVCVNEANAERKVEDILTGSISGEYNLVSPLVSLSNLNSKLVGLKHKVFLCYGTCYNINFLGKLAINENLKLICAISLGIYGEHSLLAGEGEECNNILILIVLGICYELAVSVKLEGYKLVNHVKRCALRLAVCNVEVNEVLYRRADGRGNLLIVCACLGIPVLVEVKALGNELGLGIGVLLGSLTNGLSYGDGVNVGSSSVGININTVLVVVLNESEGVGLGIVLDINVIVEETVCL